MNTDTIVKRKAFAISWPTVDFTVKDIAALGIPLSKVSIQSKINKAVQAGELTVVGKQSSPRGRSAVIYRKNIPQI